jgi:hypothetical protein
MHGRWSCLFAPDRQRITKVTGGRCPLDASSVVVKINTKIADSVVLSLVNFLLGVLALTLLRFTSSLWGLTLCWVFLPPLLVILLFLLVRDLLKPTMLRQAVFAAILCVPVVALEIWFFANLDL